MDNKFFISKTEEGKDLPLPEYMTEDSAGLDLRANLKEDIILEKGKSVFVPTGIKIQLPKNYEGQIRPRSGLAFKHGVTILNSPGTIDPDYRGEIGVILINLGQHDFLIKRGERIAQLVISKFEQAKFIEVNELEDSERGEKGFGHTGIN